MPDTSTDSEVTYVRLDRNALTFAESYTILRQSQQLHLLPLRWTRLLFGKLFRIRSLFIHAAPAKLLLAPQNSDEVAIVSTNYPQLEQVAESLNAAGFAPPRLLKNIDPRNEFPNYMLFSVDPAGEIGVSSVVMDVGWQIGAWTDFLSVRADEAFLFTSNHPDSGKLRTRPGVIHQRIPHADIETLYNFHRQSISQWRDTKRMSVDDVINQVCFNYDKQIQYWLQCGLYVEENVQK
jgi:hypothetical protein